MGKCGTCGGGTSGRAETVLRAASTPTYKVTWTDSSGVKRAEVTTSMLEANRWKRERGGKIDVL